MRRLAIFSFSFGAAALCAALLPLDGALWLLGALALSAALLTGLPLGSKKARLAVRWGAMGLAAGFLWTAGYTALFWRPAQALDDRTVRLSGAVAEWPQEREYGWSVLVRMETEGPAVPTLLFADSQAAQLRPGDGWRPWPTVRWPTGARRGRRSPTTPPRGSFSQHRDTAC